VLHVTAGLLKVFLQASVMSVTGLSLCQWRLLRAEGIGSAIMRMADVNVIHVSNLS
jgi:hypothetical protein